MGSTMTKVTMFQLLEWRKKQFEQFASANNGSMSCQLWISMAGDCKVYNNTTVVYYGTDWEKAIEIYNKLIGA